MARRTEINPTDIEPVSSALASELRGQSESDRDVFVSLQQELRRIARSKMRLERSSHTLQASGLVNEVFIKIFRGKRSTTFFQDLPTAIRYLSHAMGQILCDHANAHQAQKRGGTSQKRVPLDEGQAKDFFESETWVQPDSDLLVRPDQSEEILAVREALSLLRQSSSRQALVIELQFYAGLTQKEISSLLDISIESIKLDTRKAKAFLKFRLTTKKGLSTGPVRT
jgi:RNA polymerase sigma-70 factor, ECF subfamily